MRKMTIAVDFDGVCITNDWPNKGKDIGAQDVLRKLIESGHDIMLYTCRQDHDEDRTLRTKDGYIIELPAGKHLSEALDWFGKNSIPIVGVNYNPIEEEFDVYKPHFDMLIDDKALGIPLTTITIVGVDTVVSSDKPFAEWQGIELMLRNRGIIE